MNEVGRERGVGKDVSKFDGRLPLPESVVWSTKIKQIDGTADGRVVESEGVLQVYAV